MRTLQTLLLTACSWLFCTSWSGTLCAQSSKTNFDLNRYVGKWYEIARFDHRFERGLSHVTATYRLRSDGKIEVLNEGRNPQGKRQQAKGIARVPDPSRPDRLKVSFFLFFYAPYLVLDFDAQAYQWALVGSSSDKYLWLLARTPHPSKKEIERMIQRAKSLGYDTSRLIWVNHDL
jgi:apolipoprotein D and lipocalin family protein